MSGQQTQDRRWEVNLEVDELGQPDDRQFEQDVEAESLKVAAILLRLGGAVQSYAVRAQDEQTGLWFPIKVVFKWQSFVPGVRAPRPQPPVPAAPEPEVAVQEEGARSEPPAESVAAALAAAGVEDGMEMVDPEGNVGVIAFDQVQAALRDGWVPAAEVEGEDEGAER